MRAIVYVQHGEAGWMFLEGKYPLGAHMHEFERRTEATLDQLIEMFESGRRGMGGRCFWLNEIGTMAVQGDTEAEAYLCKVFSEPPDEVAKKTAYSYLAHAIKTPSPETAKALEVFNGDPANEAFIAAIKQYMAQRGQ